VKTSSLLVVSSLVLFSTLLMKASTAEVTPPASNGHTSAGSSSKAHDCGGEPCDAVARGFRAFFDRKLDELAANGRPCADCHMPTDSFQLSPASVEARFQFLQWRRRWNPDADDPLFRPIDADDFRTNGDAASDFSNLRQNGLVRITFPLPPNIRLIDPATNQPSAETEVDVCRRRAPGPPRADAAFGHGEALHHREERAHELHLRRSNAGVHVSARRQRRRIHTRWRRRGRDVRKDRRGRELRGHDRHRRVSGHPVDGNETVMA
jgi:hypothetical protein